MNKTLAIPGAILLGCIFIAVALYLGLTSGASTEPRRADAEENLGEDTRATGPRSEGTPGVAASPPQPEPTRMQQSEVEALARQALEKTRALMLSKCWEPAVKENPEPSVAEYFYDMTFDGRTGKALGRGISEPREKSRGDVGQCLRELPMDYTIEPPGYNARVGITITLP